MPVPVSIVIPTCARAQLLARTLHSISECVLPAALRRVVIVENGPPGRAAAIARDFIDRLPLTYDYVSTANKSRALNHVLQGSGEELMIFLDDDVRLHPRTLEAYAVAAGEWTAGKYWGGRCEVDYEQAPPSWMLHYLPPSATGWSAGESPSRLFKPCALGFNWAAFATDLKAAGGFNESRGPGTASRGQETDMQERLLAAGVAGYYLPTAIVWHYVPQTRCSERWALERSRQTALYVGVNISRKIALKRIRHDVCSAAKIHGYSWLLALAGQRLSPARQFHCRYWREWFIGVREGIRHGRTSAVRTPSMPVIAPS